MGRVGSYGGDPLARIRKAETTKSNAPTPITWEQLWITGYTSPSGAHKNGILQTKLSDLDRERMLDVKTALERGEITSDIQDYRKFSKSTAFKLFEQLKEIRRKQWLQDILDHRPANYYTVFNIHQLIAMLNLADTEEVIGVDTETTGLDIWGLDRVVGVSISLQNADRHYYIPIRHLTGDEQIKPDTAFSLLKPLLEDATKGKVLFNAKFDYYMLKKEGILLNNIIMDVMIAAHILNENEMNYQLKNLATKYGKNFGFSEESHPYEELFGKVGFENVPVNVGSIYACKDTHLVIEYRKYILTFFEAQPKLKEVHDREMKVLPAVMAMEMNGFQIDLLYAERYAKELEGIIAGLDAKLKEAFGDININSNQQLSAVLYDEMKLDDFNKRSVDADTLKILAEDCDAINILLEYRELNKLLTTYVIPLPQKLGLDGRLHGQFKQSGTVTGRFSSSDPNLQNLPYDARKLIVAPKGKILVGIDLSQIEPRILAHMSKDDHFREPYLNGTDLYSTLASKVFKLPIEECGDGSKWRKMMKTGLLATMYGTSNFTLAKQLGITIDEAENFIQTFLDTYPQVKSWIESVHKQVDTIGYVETMFGRKRRFLGHKEVAGKYHAAVNAIMRVSHGDMTILKDKERRKDYTI